ncbi:PRC-barrel domain containing protein [Kitasatospora sp. NPDC059571]|uniref:PRC-barrel domain containing protein n=1 Tax=Kitasatospora sp. NPDC059571 TaxID=3346871 RepID=UPI00367AED2B
MNDLWNHRPESGWTDGADLIGYAVEASDGRIGKVDRHSADTDGAYLVVDTGPWIFGRQVLLPAGTVTAIDHEERTVHVGRTKDEIKGAPEYVSTSAAVPPEYVSALGGYYGPLI